MVHKIKLHSAKRMKTKEKWNRIIKFDNLYCGRLRTADRRNSAVMDCIFYVCVEELKGGTRPLCPYWLQCHVTAVIINVSWCQRVSWWPTSQQSTLTLWLPPKPDLSLSLSPSLAIFTHPLSLPLSSRRHTLISSFLRFVHCRWKRELRGVEVAREDEFKYPGPTI